MGYSGATYLIQEVCNALFDALFNIIPLATEMDKVEATPSRLHQELPWTDGAHAALEELLEEQPVLIRISAAKRIRDLAERDARDLKDSTVTRDHVLSSRRAMRGGAYA